ncbi:hypothetical protein [Myxococcus xanthus]|uniref:Uncharacterized protein n=1 Tax=Myxococcus xanthus TaxID=34 RepID=A0A7Y4MS72_MYXXA|nr:hypothetical protein [Myxococcus xanthus]NOJ80339.1 hypothetical protein [Myxococcus xanthus]NOJ86771.1 hypothetical protein [Myxococcus xanthus]
MASKIFAIGVAVVVENEALFVGVFLCMWFDLSWSGEWLFDWCACLRGVMGMSAIRSGLGFAAIFGVLVLFPLPTVAGVTWLDTTGTQRAGSGYPISNRLTTNWAYASRGAEALCAQWGYARGLYTGSQNGDIMGIDCLSSDIAQWFDVPGSQVRMWASWLNGHVAVDNQAYFLASIVAHSICATSPGDYGTGFFTGYQDFENDLVGLVCIPREYVGRFGADTDDPRFPDLANISGDIRGAAWWALRSSSIQICQYRGYQTGVPVYFTPYPNSYTVVNLSVACF